MCVTDEEPEELTFIKIGFVEIIGSRDVHVIQTCDLSPINSPVLPDACPDIAEDASMI